MTDGMAVGLVKFTQQGTRLSPLLTVSSHTRPTLLSRVPNVANGGTNIGAGQPHKFQVNTLTPDQNDQHLNSLALELNFLRVIFKQILSN